VNAAENHRGRFCFESERRHLVGNERAARSQNYRNKSTLDLTKTFFALCAHCRPDVGVPNYEKF